MVEAQVHFLFEFHLHVGYVVALGPVELGGSADTRNRGIHDHDIVCQLLNPFKFGTVHHLATDVPPVAVGAAHGIV